MTVGSSSTAPRCLAFGRRVARAKSPLQRARGHSLFVEVLAEDGEHIPQDRSAEIAEVAIQVVGLPVTSCDDFVRAMTPSGLPVACIRGSHMVLAAPNRRQLSVPRHDQLDRGTLGGLIRDAGVTVEQFRELLSR